MKVALYGDWAPEGTRFLFELPRSDVAMVNLEGPVLLRKRKPHQTPKAGPHLFSRSLPNPNGDFLGDFFFSLANNHFMDFGRAGAEESISRLVNLGPRAHWSGYGASLSEARAPSIFSVGKQTLAMISATEAQFGTAGFDYPGVAAVGDWIFDAIHRAKASADYVGVSIHGGQEDIPIPSPSRRDFFRSLVEQGADFVWGHHSHVPQVWEIFRGKLIAYGLGNLAVSHRKWRGKPGGLTSIAFLGQPGADLALTWGALSTRISPGKTRALASISFAPFQFEGNPLEPMRDLLADEHLHEGVWQEFAVGLYREYGARFMGWRDRQHSSPRRMGSWLAPSPQRKQPSAALRFHMIRTQAHREMLETALGIECGEVRDYRTLKSADLVNSWRERAVRS